MKKVLGKRLLGWLLALVLVCSVTNPAVTVDAAAKTPVQKYGRLSVDGTQLVDKKGNPVQLKGVSSHGLSWYPEYMTYDSMKYMRDKWGVEVIRLAMYTAEYNGYCTGDTQNQKTLRSDMIPLK